MFMKFVLSDIPASATIQLKATEQCFPVVLFGTLYKVVLNFELLNEVLK